MSHPTTSNAPEHFKGKNALGHVAEAQARGLIASTEIHGTEIPGHLSAGADAARESAIIFLSLWLVFLSSGFPPSKILILLMVFSFGFRVKINIFLSSLRF